MGPITFVQVLPEEDGRIETARSMLIAYQSEFESTSCFFTFEQELANLPGPYSPPRGAFWLAQADGSPVGCVAVRPLTQSECEMKRLYVCPGSRGSGVGRQLVEHCLTWAKFLGYALMRLDTVPTMAAAQRLYESLGFVETEPYYSAPVVGVRCLARSL